MARPMGTASTHPIRASSPATITPMPASTERMAKVRRDLPAATVAAPTGRPIANAIENTTHETTASVVTIDSPLVNRSASGSRSAIATSPYEMQIAAISTIARPIDGFRRTRRRS